MANCLVTKLKAVVNNPDLPILEVMQQFTLDAIAASGNSSMTDVQKWALNHFFYQIGAINNNGIFAKLSHLFLPVICNSNLNKAMYNYKDDTSYEVISGVEFNNNGLISSGTANANILANTALHFTGQTNKLSIAYGFSQLKGGDISQTMMKMKVNAGGTFMDTTIVKSISLAVRWYVQERLGLSTNPNSLYGVVFGKDTNTWHGGFITQEFKHYDISEAISDAPEDASGTLYIIPVTKDSPLGIFAIGTALSSTECESFGNAIKDFISSFNA